MKKDRQNSDSLSLADAQETADVAAVLAALHIAVAQVESVVSLSVILVLVFVFILSALQIKQGALGGFFEPGFGLLVALLTWCCTFLALFRTQAC